MSHEHSVQSFGDGDSVDNTSTYDVLQLISWHESKPEPAKFVNANALRTEQQKRQKLKNLYSEQTQKNERLVNENSELADQ